ncbi:MAG: ATP-binding cassette domain-containing protein, partial [Pseudomonadota bacterium]|nr:ATP-binding cassette domain-containing protein [Pseudomonadota bacterium]
MPNDGHIVLRDVFKSFGKKVVLDGINLSVPRGRSLVVIGGSGTGKSVMIKCILGLLRPDRGSIAIGGEEMAGITGAERDRFLARAGMLFQGAALFDSLPVWQNVAFGLIQGKQMQRKEAREIAVHKLA